MKKNNNKGFTLAELLIVVAIIAVLVAIAIPVFTSQLEKSRDMTSLANIRSAYAEAQASYLSEVKSDNNVTITKTNGKITSVAVANVKFAGVQSGWSLADGQTVNTILPNGIDWSTALTDAVGAAAGNYTLTFSYADDGTISVAAAKGA